MGTTEPAIDDLFSEYAKKERKLNLPNVLSGLDMRPNTLVEPAGSTKSLLLIVSSYPTLNVHSSIHIKYGSVNDILNMSMFTLYAKLGLYRADICTTGAMHVNVIARRLDRKNFYNRLDNGIIRKLPNPLRTLWYEYSEKLIELSEAPGR